jgi:cobalt-zinc-cadmium efflux system outer membrane protein
MRAGTRLLALCVFACVQATTADAQTRVLTLSEVLERAREQAPSIVSARLAVDEARGRVTGAAARFQTNPQIEAGIGNRTGPDRRFTDLELGIGQAFEPGARRSARLDAANAAVAQASAGIEAATRIVLQQAAAAYYRVTYANERIKLLSGALELASSVYSIADRRFRAGDIAVLDVNLARASLSRVRAEREGVEAMKAATLGELGQLLAIENAFDVAGPLTKPAQSDFDAALQSAQRRPEIQVLGAAVQEADADLRVGLTFLKPEYGANLRYSRDGGDQVVIGGLTISLPAFSRGQEQRAVASARAARLRADLDAVKGRVATEVRSSFETFTRRLAAVNVLEAEVTPALDESEQLATRSFDVGQIGLPDLLLIRREILETRIQYLDALLEAVLARTDLEAAAGVLR